MPLLTKYFFGIDNYARVFPKISFASNLGAAISLSMVGYIYDFFGSYLYAFIIALAMIAVCVITLTLTAKTKNRGGKIMNKKAEQLFSDLNDGKDFSKGSRTSGNYD